MEAIRAENLTVEYYHSHFSLKNINLSINEGEIILLTGQSGSGKSTLLYSLSGIIPHCINVKTYKGSVYIADLKVKETPFSSIMKSCGVVLQNPTSQIFGMTVEEDMVFGLENICLERDEIKRRVEETLAFVNLEKYREADPLSLSGGEKQRVAIGSMLVMEPKIIFLDEPTSNLDPRGTREILLMLKRLKESKKTTILVERKIEHIVPYVNRIIALDGGNIALDAEPRKFFANEDLVKKLGVNPPQVIRTAYRLKEKTRLKNIPLSIQELHDILVGIKRET
ncbi:MAG: energy-coupling factor ABC transporter ATP-binding protein [Candidatus Asgardarchaeia archaeon]